MTEPLILGFDQSSHASGICRWGRAFRDGSPVHDLETVRVKSTGAQCLMEWDRWITEELRPGRDSYSMVVCEAHVNQYASGVINHQILGLIMLACVKRDIPLLIVAPDQLKKYATGNGDAKKGDMVAAANAEFGLSLVYLPHSVKSQDDQADALWLCEIGRRVLARDFIPEAAKGTRDAIVEALCRSVEEVKAQKSTERKAKAERKRKREAKKQEKENAAR